jgi:hypothetical protein
MALGSETGGYNVPQQLSNNNPLGTNLDQSSSGILQQIGTGTTS